MYRLTGPAKVFVSEPAAMAAIKANQLSIGDVLVLIGRGPMGWDGLLVDSRYGSARARLGGGLA